MMIRVPIRPRLIVLPKETYPKFQYASSIDFNFKVMGMNSSVESEEVKKTIVYINPQDQIYLN